MRGERVNPYWFYIVLGYLMGGMLFADWLPKWLHGADVAANSDDGNPGTFNAFAQCGVLTGMLVLTCELGKAFLPVFAAGRRFGVEDRLFALVMLAPVLGHIFPLARRGHGGKGIAASFGVLLALAPDIRPAATLAMCYILFSTALRVESHLWRSVVTYAAFAALAWLRFEIQAIRAGCVLVAAVVIVKHLIVRPEGDAFSMRLFGRRTAG